VVRAGVDVDRASYRQADPSLLTGLPHHGLGDVPSISCAPLGSDHGSLSLAGSEAAPRIVEDERRRRDDDAVRPQSIWIVETMQG